MLKSKSLFKYFIISSLLLMLIGAIYAERVFRSGLCEAQDVLESEIPLASFFVNTVKNKAFALWNPYKILGIPFSEVSFMGPYYPFVTFYFLFSLTKAINYAILSHIILTAFFMLLLCRELKFNALIGLFCAITWVSSNVFREFSAGGWLPQIISTTYLPLLVFLFLKAIRTYFPVNIIYCLFGGIASALTITGGIPHYTAIILYCLIIFSLPLLKSKKKLGLLSLMLVLGILISIVYWGPILLQVKNTLLSPRTESGLIEEGYTFKELFNFLVPTLHKRGYIGKLALLLGLWGLLLKHKFSGPVRLLSGICFILILKYTFFGLQIINYVPLANQDRIAWPWQIGLVFSLVIASGVALDKLKNIFKNKKILYALTLLFFLGLQFCDLYQYKELHKTKIYFTTDEYFKSSPIFTFLRKDGSLFRVCNRLVDFKYFHVNQNIMENVCCLQATVKGVAIPKITGDIDLHAHSSYLLMDRKPALDLCNTKYMITSFQLDSADYIKHLTMEDAVSTIHSGNALRSTEWTHFREHKKAYLYENKNCFPRAFIIENMSISRLQAYFTGNNIPECLGELDIPQDVYQILANHKKVDIEWLPNTYRISCENSSDSFLFLSEMHDSGWKAKLDNKKIEIFSPYGVFMGIFVPKGKHVVEFHYRPRSFFIFLGISSVAAIGAVFLLIVLIIKIRLIKK